MRKLTILFVFSICASTVFAQIIKPSTTPTTSTFSERVEASLIANKPVDKAELNQVIQKEVNSLDTDKQPTKKRLSDLIELVAYKTELDFTQYIGKSPPEISSIKQLPELSKYFLAKKPKLSEKSASALLKKVKKYLSKRKDPHIAEIHWTYYSLVSPLMENGKAARTVWRGIINSQISQGLLSKALKTSLDWAASKHPSNAYQFEALNQIANLPNGTYDITLYESNFKKMQSIAKKGDDRIIVHKSRLDYLKGQFALCENELAPLLNTAADSKFYQRYYFKIKVALQKCYVADKKKQQVTALYTKKMPPALETYFQKHLDAKLKSELRFQIGFGQRKEAFKACTDLLGKEKMSNPYSYLMTLSTCFTLKGPTEVWPTAVVTKYTSDIKQLSIYAEKSKEMALLMQAIRETYKDFKLPKGTASATAEIIKRFGSDELISIALDLKKQPAK